MPASSHPPSPPRPPAHPASPLGEDDIDTLQALLDQVPEPLEPLDTSMLDGFLCGVLIQPQRIPESRWLPHITDVDGRPLPPRFNPAKMHALALRRYAELDGAIQRREWFDPWVFELEEGEPSDEADGGGDPDEDEGPPPDVDSVYPWVAGFATAMELFPALMAFDEQLLTEPLALLYRHLAPDDLEDADALLAEIESLEPPEDLTEAVEGLVRATLLLADVGRPLSGQGQPGRPQQQRQKRQGQGGGGGGGVPRGSGSSGRRGPPRR